MDKKLEKFEKWSVRNLPFPSQIIPRWMLGPLEMALKDERGRSYGTRSTTGVVPWARIAFLAWKQYRTWRPHKPDLVYSYKLCPCGARHAYDKNGRSGTGITGYWDCSDILLGKAGHPGSVIHGDTYPFAFWDLKADREYTERLKGVKVREDTPIRKR